MKMEVSCNLDFFIPEILLDFYRPGNPEPHPQCRGPALQRRIVDDQGNAATHARHRHLPALRALGITPKTFHLNEQHGVVLAIQLIAEELTEILKHTQTSSRPPTIRYSQAAETVSQRLVYTIHTPVKAGHDRFNKSLYAGISHKSCQTNSRSPRPRRGKSACLQLHPIWPCTSTVRPTASAVCTGM